MTASDVMAELKALGTEQNRKTYARHGYSGSLFGVSFANLGKLQKRIKCDHALALALWETGNGDARNLATMIADPAAITSRDLDAWIKSVTNYGHADLVARYVASKSPHAAAKAETWTASKSDFVSQAGWTLIAILATSGEETPDSYFEAKLKIIEQSIAKAQNRTRHAMNSALIAIGMRSTALEKLALAAAARIGKVEVDHGETNCVTPDAAAYIRKAGARKKPATKKAARPSR